MAATSTGSIVYEVGIDLTGLQAGLRQVNDSLNGLNRTVDINTRHIGSLERQAEATSSAMSRLSGVAKSLMAALSVQQVASYSDAWTELNNKVSNSIRVGETQAEVMQRIFDVSQATQSSLNGTAVLYSRLERGTREYNTSAEDLVRLTTIINQGFAVSGATAQEAENAIIQLSQGIAAGVLRGEEFNSVSEQGSRLMIALADSLGVGIGQLRKMAAEGKLTTDVVVKGLLSQGDVIGKEFEKTTVSIAKGLQVAGNNITKFFGESSTVKSFSVAFRDSVISISENLDQLGQVLAVVAAVVGSRYVGAMTMAAAATAKQVLANRQLVLAERDSTATAALQAQGQLRAAEAAKVRALEEVRLAQMMKATAITTTQTAAAEAALSAARTAAATAAGKYNAALAANTAAQNAAAAAASRASIATGIMRGALGLVGGPVGAAMLAGAAIYYFWQQAEKAKTEARELADGVENLTSNMKSMSRVQLSAEIAKLRDTIPQLTEDVADAQDAFNKATGRVKNYQREIDNWGESTKRGRQAAQAMQGALDDQAVATANLESAQNRLSRVQSTIGIAQAQVNGQFKQGIDLLKRHGEETGVVAGMMNQLGNSLNFAAKAQQNFNSSSLVIQRPAKVQEYLDKLSEQVELEGELDERKRAQLRAEKEIRALGGSDADVRMARERAGAEYDLIKAQQDRRKEESASQSASKKAASQQESIAQKLENLREKAELAAASTAELSREQTILSAKQSLGKAATEDQIRLAGEYAARAYDAAKALKDQQKAEKEKQRVEQSYQGLRAIASPTTGIDSEYQQRMADLDAYAAAYPQKITEIEQTRAAIEAQYRQQRMDAMWAEWQQQSLGAQLFGTALDSAMSTASNSITGLLTGTMSVQDAMRSLGSTVLNSLVNSFVEMGVQWVKSAVMGQTAQVAATATTTAAQTAGLATTTAASTAAAATTTAAWTPAAIVASIGSFGGAAAIGVGAVLGALAMGIAGKRKNGGPVSAGSMYEVGENGLPEVFQASNGRQYMIPGNDGSVISNKDLTGGGSGVVVYNSVINNSSAQVRSSARDNGDGSVTIETIVSDIENNGAIGQAISRNYSTNRRATE
ncbi:tail length tape measure protein [Salmonella phage Skate]|uniref:Tape measure protein n=1 Tax=Salmonella phage Skate TaxID=2234035 RepID=A0A2Z5HSY5_9CAUD|nr:tail length tape measure protein [Salmonella phage Skate]AXC43020.1 tape measure protein [Salmonella phage Skate]